MHFIIRSSVFFTANHGTHGRGKHKQLMQFSWVVLMYLHQKTTADAKTTRHDASISLLIGQYLVSIVVGYISISPYRDMGGILLMAPPPAAHMEGACK